MNSLLLRRVVYKKILTHIIIIISITLNNYSMTVDASDIKIRKQRYLVHPPPSNGAGTKMQVKNKNSVFKNLFFCNIKKKKKKINL